MIRLTPSWGLVGAMTLLVLVLLIVGCGRTTVDPLEPMSREAAEQLARENPKDANAWLAVANVRCMHGDKNGAIVAAGTALDLNPKLGLAHIVRAEAIRGNFLSDVPSDEQRKKANKEFGKAIEVAPNDAEVWYRYARTYYDPEEAWQAAAIDRAIALNPSHGGALQARARRAFRPDRPATTAELQAALDDLNIAVTDNDLDRRARAYYLRGRAHLRMKQRDKAREDFERASELEPQLRRMSMEALAEYDLGK